MIGITVALQASEFFPCAANEVFQISPIRRNED
jgi:hypothetical protein